MNKTEFLHGLEEALAGEVPDSVIRENLNYYSNYISGEVSRGRTEKEVLDELGSPRLIARTIISSTEAAEDPGSYSSGTYRDSTGRDSGRKPHEFHMSGGLISIILLVLAVVIIFGVMKLAGGMIFILIRYAGPILFVVLLLAFIRKMRK